MGGIAGQLFYTGPDGDFSVFEMDVSFLPFTVLQDIRTWCSFGLVAYKKDIILRLFQTRFKMVDDSAARAHAAAGNNDGRAGDFHEFFMVVEASDGVEAIKVKRVVAMGCKVL